MYVEASYVSFEIYKIKIVEYTTNDEWRQEIILITMFDQVHRPRPKGHEH